MLNISNNKKAKLDSIKHFSTVSYLENRPHFKVLNKIMVGLVLLVVLIVFLPWTQNVAGSGAVTTLKPDQRPQTIHSVIAGRIEKWYVQEGDFVQQGDTILFISETKDDYFDPNLVQNTGQQLKAKQMSLESYGGKVDALNSQISALGQEKLLKIQQAKNKITQAYLKIKSDSIDLEAAKTQNKIAATQFERSNQLYQEGLKPLTDLEDKKLKLQDAQAKIINQENKLLSAKNDLINSKVEVNRLVAEYSEKISKAGSDKYSTLSSQFDTEVQVNKLENQYINYSIRNGMYYITAPQNGYVNRALQSGMGETIKEGTPIVSIMPSNYDLAVETFVNPIDLPLLQKNTKVRVWFDGWPTIIFSGWPNMSYGTFGGRVVAIETFISTNGKYRILIAPDAQEAPWPKQLSIGAGAQTIALLETVPVWFEIWRTLNGFPPNYYKDNANDASAT